jgi:RNA polymerase sigma factor (sigma-70 family)
MLVRMTGSDMDLLGKFVRDQSQDAFTALVQRHLGLVYCAGLRQVRSPQLAEEVAQSVFTDLARNAARLKPDTILTAWLYQVTRRTAINVVRGEARRQLREQIAVEMNAMNATAADWTHIEPLLDDAMHTLGDADRTAVLLRYFEGKPAREMAQTLGISDEAAQKRVSRAVERLREFFAQRGVTVGASGLVVVISANAVQAAPVGLAGTLSTAAVLAGTTLTTTATVGKAIAMTTLQKTLAVAVVVAAASLGVLLPSVSLFWPSSPARALNSQVALGWVQLGKEVALQGLVPANQQHDGVTEPSLMGGVECHSLQRYPNGIELWSYFRIDPALKNQLTNLCIIEVEYFDADAGGHFHLDYDSYDESGTLRGAYTQSKERVYLKGTQRWRRVRFLLDDARFEGRQNDQADFRVAAFGPRFFLRSVKLFHE